MAVNGCHVMAKPTGSVCNIDCSYCFYLEKEALYPERKQNWRMSDETLELYIKQHIAAQDNKHVLFAWQGGEPLMMGLSFFKKVVELCEKYGNDKHIQHSLQTNGILINTEWAIFFAKYKFLVGLSIDGPQTLHDKYRVSRSGVGTHQKVMEALSLLKHYGVDFNVLTVVGKHNANHAAEVYAFLVAAGALYIQFIPLVERVGSSGASKLSLVMPGESMAKIAPWSVPAWQYGEFLSQIFDIWSRRDIGRISVQIFDVALAAWCEEQPLLCVHSESCGHAFALESNGDLYNCDHFVYPEHLLGNIHQQTLRELNNSKRAIDFGKMKNETLTADCRQCEFLFVCHGGCPKHRFAVSPSGNPRHNYLCTGYKHFFQHISQKMNLLRDLIAHGYPPQVIMQIQDKHRLNEGTSRNTPCPCGSGKKSKKCCGK